MTQPDAETLAEPFLSADCCAQTDRAANRAVGDRQLFQQGYCVSGQLRVTADVQNLTHAPWLRQGQQHPLLLRFGQMFASSLTQGAALYGLSMRLQTPQGPWDFVGQSCPHFMADDAPQFQAYWQAMTADSDAERAVLHYVLHQPQAWLFWLWQHSRLATVDRLASLSAYGVHAFCFWNAASERTWVKFRLQAIDPPPPSAQKVLPFSQLVSDLSERLQQPIKPQWALQMQLLTPEQQRQLGDQAFAASCPWPNLCSPWQTLAYLSVEQDQQQSASATDIAFNPGHILPGLGFSPDPLLQQRLQFYQQAQTERLGAGFEQRLVNRGPGVPPLLPPSSTPVSLSSWGATRDAWQALGDDERQRLAQYLDQLAARLTPGDAERLSQQRSLFI